MALCINKNSVQYQSLKNRAGIPEFILEAVSRDFMEKYGRLPHLDELPNSNSEPYLRDQLGVTKQNSAKVESILEMTGKETVEEAVIDINNQFRDLETTIVPINKEALVDIVHRPTDNNFDNWTEEDQILAEAPRDNNGNLLAPNGKVSNLTEKQYIQVRTKAFKDWFGDWEKFANITEEELQAASLIFDRVPELSKIGTPTEYAAYIKEIFPNSVEKEVYWHGSNEDFSEGFASAKRGEGSGALETKKRNDLYLNKQGWASLQYVNGINRKGRDKNGFAHWNKLWWELKEIMSNGRRENNDWKNIIIDESTIRQAIPNKKGVFNRDSGGKNGKWLSERKADYGYENKSDKEFFEEIFGIKLGKDTFNTWTARNAEIFKSLEKSAKGINPVIIDVRNPIIEEGQNTYYEEQRGLFTIANAKGNDAILSKKADNEFNSDVAVVINANNDNVYWLGTKSDIERFRQWKTNNNASKVVDENGEPLVVYHGSKSIFNVFDPSKSKSRQYLSQQIKPTNFFSSDKTVADFFALTENQSLASQISKSISIVLDAFAGENVDENILDDEIWTDAARRTGKSKEFVKDFWENRVPREYKIHDEFGITRMEDPDIDKYKYNVFLNMKSPIILDAKGERADRFIEANKEVLDNNDEIIIININETIGKKDTATDYLVRNPNRIKSAVSNLGAFSRLNRNIYDIEPNGYLVLNNALQKLASLHGITFNETSDAELNSEKWQGIIPDASLVNAFIYNGQIYINLDRANLDAPIHEMFHMFVGSLRFTNPSLYQALVDSTQSFPNYEQLVQEYPGRTRNDVNEEILVTEVSRYLTGQPSSLAKMDSKTRYEISYNIKRMLDTILMGQDSVKTISEDRLFNLSLKEIAQEVNSAVMVNNFTGTMNVEGSELHRRLNNVKSDLYREGTLEEHCD